MAAGPGNRFHDKFPYFLGKDIQRREIEAPDVLRVVDAVKHSFHLFLSIIYLAIHRRGSAR